MIQIENVTRNDLLKVCEYYKGEDKCPSGTKEMFWDYERLWVELRMNEDSDELFEFTQDYNNAGLIDFELFCSTVSVIGIAARCLNALSRSKSFTRMST